MSSVECVPKLLIVDTAPAMAQVLKTYAELNNYESDVFCDSEQACAALAQRFSNPDVAETYDCMILGWPEGRVRVIADLLEALTSPDHTDLPIIVLSEEPDKDIKTFARRRRSTHTLLWKDYKHIENVLQRIVINEKSAATSATSAVAQTAAVAPVDKVSLQNTNYTKVTRSTLPTSILLVDDTSAICRPLKDMLEDEGYTVAFASTAVDARNILNNRKFDLVLTEFFLHQESGKDFCNYLKSIREDRRPVYAVMAAENLGTAVQQSLSAGAITCLDKSESTENLFTRVNAIASGLNRGNMAAATIATDTAAQVHTRSDVNTRAKTAGNSAGIADLVNNSLMPSILIDSQQNIIAANQEAATLLSGGDQLLLDNLNFEKSIHGVPVRVSPQESVRALFRDLDGKVFSVAYRSRNIAGSDYSLAGNICMLTFESVDRKIVSAVNETALQSDAVIENKESVTQVDELLSAGVTPSSVDLAAVLGVEDAGGQVVSEDAGGQVVSEDIVFSGSMTEQITKALSNKAYSSTCSLLMLDVKMAAAVTGDRVSLGKSELMKGMVEAGIASRCGSNVSMEYNGAGRFVLLYKSDQPERSRARAEQLVTQMPGLLADLTDVELLSHSSFIDLSVFDQSGKHNITAYYVLNLCIAACMKTELDGLDNRMYDINASGKLQGVRSSEVQNEVADSHAYVSAPYQQIGNQHERQTA